MSNGRIRPALLSVLLVFGALSGAALGAAAPESPAVSRPASESFIVTGFQFAGNDSVDSSVLTSLLSDAVGRPVDLAGLEALAQRVTDHYRANGFWVARAYLPEQEITDGTVLIAVVEGRYGEVKVEGTARLPAALADEYLRDVQEGAVIRGPSLERALLLLSDLPGVSASASLAPGREPGTADLAVRIEQAERVRGSLAVNNHQAEAQGGAQTALSVRWSNPMGYADELSVTLLSSSSGTQYGRVAFEAPVNDRELRLNLAYAASSHRLGGEFASLDASSRSQRLSAVASHPVTRTERVQVSGRAGYAQTRLTDAFGALSESGRTVSGLTASVEGEWRTASGGWVSASVDVRSGSVRFESEDGALFDAATARTAGAFQRVTGDVALTFPLGDRGSLTLSAAGQLASKNLDPTEKLSLSGPEGVRAYGAGELSADEGWRARAGVKRAVALRWVPGRLEGLLFFDAAQGRVNKSPWPGSGPNELRTLAGAGAGLAWARGPISVEIAYALPVAGGAAGDGRLWWQGVWRF